MLNELLTKTIIDIFPERVKEYPDQIAVMDVRGAYTYDQLNRRSALLAGKLLEACKSFGTDVKAASAEGKNGPRIAVLLPRTREYLVALLAVLRAGCAIVPLDSEYPKERNTEYSAGRGLPALYHNESACGKNRRYSQGSAGRFGGRKGSGYRPEPVRPEN